MEKIAVKVESCEEMKKVIDYFEENGEHESKNYYPPIDDDDEYLYVAWDDECYYNWEYSDSFDIFKKDGFEELSFTEFESKYLKPNPKDLLEDGMVVENRDGKFYFKLYNKFLDILDCNYIGYYEEDLSVKYHEDFDIMKIYKGTITDYENLINNDLELIWEREEYEEITTLERLVEVCNELNEKYKRAEFYITNIEGSFKIKTIINDKTPVGITVGGGKFMHSGEVDFEETEGELVFHSFKNDGSLSDHCNFTEKDLKLDGYVVNIK